MRRFHTRWRLAIAVVATVASMASMSTIAAPAPASAVPADLTGVAAQVEPTVARIDTTINYQRAIGAGTGIVIDPSGTVMTNFHVVQGADSITATVAGRSFPADLVGYDRNADVAVLQLRGAGGLPMALLGDSSQLAPGDPVVALGNARGSGSPLTQEAGEVVAFGRTISAKDELTGSSNQLTGLIEFAAPVRAGRLGWPIGERSRAGRRHDDGCDGQLPHGSRRVRASPSPSTTHSAWRVRFGPGCRRTACTSDRRRCSGSA